MAGSGSRFKNAGYKQSKPLIQVHDIPMVLHAINSYPQADKWIFIIRKEHVNNTQLIDTIKSVYPNTIFLVDDNPVGQLNSLMVAKEYFIDAEKIFVGACDLALVNLHNVSFDTEINPVIFTNQKCLVKNPYSWGWVQIENDHIIKTSCKKPISDDPYNDYALTGCFTFNNGNSLLKLAEYVFNQDMQVNGEYYVDTMIQAAINLGFQPKFTIVDYYISWGTPNDYEAYNKLYNEWKQGYTIDNTEIEKLKVYWYTMESKWN